MFQNKKTIGDYKNFEETVGLDVVTTSMRAFVFVSRKEKITTIKKPSTSKTVLFSSINTISNRRLSVKSLCVLTVSEENMGCLVFR